MSKRGVLSSKFNMSLGFIPVIVSIILCEFITQDISIYIGAGVGALYSLYTLWGNYRVELLYGCVIGAGQWRDRAFMYEANLDGLLDYAAYHTTFTSTELYSEEDRIIVLSTCSYEFDDARYIVIGKLTPQ